MTEKQFRHDMRRGLGSCLLEMERCTDIEDYRKDVLWGLQYAQAYDAQSEGTRAIYFHDMISLFDDQTAFYVSVADGAKRGIRNVTWHFAHYMSILALMAGGGHSPAQQAMAELYELLLQAIRTGRTSGSRIWPATDNFSYLCVETLTNALQTQEARETFFLRVLTDYGKLIRERPDLCSRFQDDWFEHVAAEHLGKERVKALLAEQTDPDIGRYLANRNTNEEERTACQAEQRNDAENSTAASIYQKLSSGARPGRELPLLLLRRMENLGRGKEITVLGRLYAQETSSELRYALLRLFRIDSVIALLPEECVPQLIRDAEHEDKAIRGEALRVLGERKREKVRDYALQRLEQRPRDGDAILMLLNNFRPGDGKRLIRLVKSVSLNEHHGDWHGVFSAVRNLIEQNPEADKELSAALLPYMLREGYCSCCRLYLLELMQPRGLLTPELIEECRRDCNLEIREFVHGLKA